jgi:hypothetical protein
VHRVIGFSLKFSDVLVNIAARELSRNAVFNPIRDAVIGLAQRAIQRLHSHREGDANDDTCLSFVHEFNSDDETDPEGNSQYEEEANDEMTPRIFVPQFVLDRYALGPEEFDILSERLPSSLGDYELKYEMFDGYMKET